jgi:hypothetical protein
VAKAGRISKNNILSALSASVVNNIKTIDDAKLIRLLSVNTVPFILPALIIYQLLQEKMIDRKTALWALKQLAEFISEDEYSTVRLLMEKER